MRQYTPAAYAVVLASLALGLLSAVTPVRAADDQLVAKAKKLVGEATSGLVASTKPKTPSLN